jgi:ribonuclease VapC
MIIDSSAAIAVLEQEPDAQSFASAIAGASSRYMGAPTFLELCMIIAGNRADASIEDVGSFVRDAGITLLPFTPAAAKVAAEAFLKFGKGRHPAKLNFGDCISYAMAKTEVMPLLFKGDDFRLTDVEVAL